MRLDSLPPLPRLKAPAGLQGELLPFQERGLGWMVAQERSEHKGGILADEMGLGKTIQTIALLLESKQRKRVAVKPEGGGAAAAAAAAAAPKTPAPTLIVVPVSAMQQWEDEMKSFTGGGLSTKVYYGSDKKGVTTEELLGYDVVLTTYQTVEYDWRKCEMKSKVQCQHCQRYFLPKKLIEHNTYFCGPTAFRTAKQSKTEKKTKAKGTATTSVNLGGSAFLEGVAAPSAGGASAAAASGSSPPKAEPTPSITNIYRGIIAETDREPVSMYENTRRKRAAADSDAEDDDDDDEGGQAAAAAAAPAPAAELWACSICTMVNTGGRQCEACQSPRQKPPAKKRRSASPETIELLDSDSDSDEKAKVEKSPGDDGEDSDDDFTDSSKKRWSNKAEAEAEEKRKAEKEEEELARAIAMSQDGRRFRLGDRVRAVAGLAPEDAANLIPEATGKIIEVSEDHDDDEPYFVEVLSKERGDTTWWFKEHFLERVQPEVQKGKRKAGTSVKQERKKPKSDGAQAKKKEPERDKVTSVLSSDTWECGTCSFRNHAAMPQCEMCSADKPLPSNEIDLSSSVLHSITFDRIILDEAHKIKSRTTNTAKSCIALASNFKWCLSGTPLQNNVGELYGLVKFLRQDPYAYYECGIKGCNCKSLHWNMGRGLEGGRACADCGHAPFKHFSHFNKFIMNPLMKNGYQGTGKQAMLRLQNDVLAKLQLRRTKAIIAKEINLPPLTVKLTKFQLSDEEKDFYTQIYKRTELKYDTFAAKGTILHNYAHIFDLLSRLRQACDHPYLVRYGVGSEELPERVRNTDGAGDLCGICQELVEEDTAAVSKCGCVFHIDCVTEYCDSQPASDDAKVKCPQCHQGLTVKIAAQADAQAEAKAAFDADKKAEKEEEKRQEKGGAAAADLDLEEDDEEEEEDDEIALAKAMSLEEGSSGAQPSADSEDKEEEKDQPAAAAKPAAGAKKKKAAKLGAKTFMHKVDTKTFQTSSKLDAVVKTLQDVKKKTPDHKSIVFSQFTNFLDIVEWQLRKTGFNPVKLIGSMSAQRRGAVLREFKESAEVDVILLSLRAGGEGLNLQCASHVLLLDPWWNPAVELQAIQRAHRIGQTRAVQAYRFVSEETIEERMLALQEKKRLVFEATISGQVESMVKLTLEDIRFLFKHSS